MLQCLKIQEIYEWQDDNQNQLKAGIPELSEIFQLLSCTDFVLFSTALCNMKIRKEAGNNMFKTINIIYFVDERLAY